METQSLVVPFCTFVAPFYPPALREAIEDSVPTIVLQAARLSMEVLAAEQRGLTFAEAVCHSDFPLMERTYFTARAMFQHRLPPEVQAALGNMLKVGLEGGLDPLRKLIFAVASRSDDPDAAMCRFFLWVSIQLNVLGATWDAPEVEMLGTLREMEDKGESVL
jgi:hypothetical protein